MKKIGVVITTIANGDFLNEFNDAVAGLSGLLDVKFYIVGDLNTPPVCRQKVIEINNTSFACCYMAVEEQDSFLEKSNFPVAYIPYRSDNRRNVGYLKAFEEGCEVIVSMDDDNFPVDRDFFLQHSVVGDAVLANSLSSEHSWVNPMKLLAARTLHGEEVILYPRGYPYAKRWKDNTRINDDLSIRGKVDVNVGLWTGDPDVDAVTRLATMCNTEVNRNWQNNLIYGLGENQFMPINSQNTAIARECIFAYYFVKMGYSINNMRMDRFGDIFSGFFLQMCAHAVQNIITIGNPMVRQLRNEHNLLKDLVVELPGILIVEDLIPFLESALPKSSNYADAYLSLIESLNNFVHGETKSSLWTAQNLVFISEITEIMKAWVKTCNILK